VDLDHIIAVLTEADPELLAALDETLEVEGPLWVPNVGPQTQAFFSEADELFFGGQVGGGKTDLILGLALVRHAKSLILRRQSAEIDGLESRLFEVLDSRDGYNGQKHTLVRGDKLIKLGGCQYEHDKQNYKGRPYDFYGFDEISDFTESQFDFITTWNRSTIPGQRCRVVGAGNPPTTPEGMWVVRRWAAWLDPQHPRPARPGELRWYLRNEEGEEEEVTGPGPYQIGGQTITARSRTFIPSTLRDNPDLKDTNYASRLNALPEELRSAYRDGNFTANLRDDPYQVIPTQWVFEAQKRWISKAPVGVPMCAMGVDVAVAKDKFVIAPRFGGYYDYLEVIPGADISDPKDMAGKVVAMRRDNAQVIVDVGGGWGADCYGQLKANGIPSTGYMGVKPTRSRSKDGMFAFSNTRTAALWAFREALDPTQPGGSQIMLPPDVELRADLCAPSYKVKGSIPNAILIAESKEEVCKRLGRSPDRGDAVIMAWHGGTRQEQLKGGWTGGRSAQQPVVNRGRRYK
jgi:hypothetical protein